MTYVHGPHSYVYHVAASIDEAACGQPINESWKTFDEPPISIKQHPRQYEFRLCQNCVNAGIDE